MSIDGETLKTDFMVKRSQMKGIFKAENYRSRWFVLTSNVLRYHEGALEVSHMTLVHLPAVPNKVHIFNICNGKPTEK